MSMRGCRQLAEQIGIDRCKIEALAANGVLCHYVDKIVDRWTWGRAREAVVRFYGLAGTPPEDLRTIGRKWGVSASRARQIRVTGEFAMRQGERRGELWVRQMSHA